MGSPPNIHIGGEDHLAQAWFRTLQRPVAAAKMGPMLKRISRLSSRHRVPLGDPSLHRSHSHRRAGAWRFLAPGTSTLRSMKAQHLSRPANSRQQSPRSPVPLVATVHLRPHGCPRARRLRRANPAQPRAPRGRTTMGHQTPCAGSSATPCRGAGPRGGRWGALVHARK